MAEAVLRDLDRDLPRLDMRSPALIARQSPKKVDRAPRSRSRMTPRERQMAEAAMQAAMQAVDRAREFAEATVDRASAIMADAEQRAAEIIAAAKAEAERVLTTSGAPIKDIIREVAARHDVEPALILSQRRTQRLVAIRHEAIALAHLRRPDLSLPQLGRAFNRDHTSILHALRKTGAYLGRKASYGAGEAP